MNFAQNLLNWFDVEGRHDLPWQENMTPYRVWVSEIMLQQTQVQTVIPYYQKFMQRFPDIEALAQASQDEVLQHWAGLGYYARGRNLHKSAQMVCDDFGGLFPNTFEEVIKLPGIGKSTAGAILALACKKRYAILDGNVKRVLCRFDAVEAWSGEKQTEQLLWQRAEALTPLERFDDYTQAIMDLGATLCTRSKPNCEACPVRASCKAYALDRVKDFPFSKPKKIKPTRSTQMLVMLSNNRVALQQRPQKGIWGGLWSLPEYVDTHEIKGVLQADALKTSLVKWPEFKHTFTHYHLMITPVLFELAEQEQPQLKQYKWVALDELANYGLPAPVASILKRLEEQKCLEP